MIDYEGEKHVERMTSSRPARPVHGESDNPVTKPKAERRTGVVLSCGNKRKTERRKIYDEDIPEQGQRKRKRRQREQGLPHGADQILVVALKDESLASHLKSGDKVYVEQAFNLQTSSSSAPTPAADSGEQSEKQKPDDRDYIVTLSGKPPRTE